MAAVFPASPWSSPAAGDDHGDAGKTAAIVQERWNRNGGGCQRGCGWRGGGGGGGREKNGRGGGGKRGARRVRGRGGGGGESNRGRGQGARSQPRANTA